MSINRSYRLVSQKGDSADEEEEELTLYDKQFGQGAYEENVELIFRQRKGKSKYKHGDDTSNRRLFGFCAIVLVALLIAIIAGYTVWMINNNNNSPGAGGDQSTSVPTTTPSPVTSNGDDTTSIVTSPTHWRAEFQNRMSEASLITHDVNNDGITDIVTSMVTSRFQNRDYDYCPDFKSNRCMDEFGYTPCQAHLLALSGNSGELIWDKWVEYGPFALNCRVDLNSDGQNDCIFAGRLAGFSAYDIHNNDLLWVVDPSVTCPAYNYYFPLLSKDFNNDGVTDIIAVHGGDPSYDDAVKNRSPGFLVIISGATGQQISDHIFMPDTHESYSSPVLYTLPNGVELVLFGSGGETISGSLWAITLDSLTENVKKYSSSHQNQYAINKSYKYNSCYSKEEFAALRPTINKNIYSTSKKESWMSKCPILPGNMEPFWNTYDLCVYEFIPAGKGAGTMLPPVVVDINSDGKNDLIVSQFNEHTLLYDGATGAIVWDHYESITQTYSTPAPLHFNNDNTLDVLMRFNKGHWMMYDYSYLGVLDGTNGDLLWHFKCSDAVMSSPVILKSRDKGSDAMIFIGTGCGMGDDEQEKEGEEGAQPAKGAQGGNTRRSAGHRPLVCPRKQFEFYDPKYTPTVTSRERRDENGFFPMDGSGKDEEGTHANPGGEQEVPIDIDLSQYLPDDLWTAKNSSDSFPDPWTDTDSFIEDYCQVGPVGKFEASLYFLTPQLISKSTTAIPLFSFRPYVYKPSSTETKRQKRHSGANDEILEAELKNMKRLMSDRKGLRCAHIMIPSLSAATPIITDLDSDGKFEIVTSISYSFIIGDDYSRRAFYFLHPPKAVVQSFTIDTRLKAAYGDIAQGMSIDTNSYYPLEEQPWTQYMGREGNGIYNTNSS